jgi:hypothetical protein
MRYTPSFFLRYLFECPCQRVRRLLSRYHWAYLRKHYPYQRFTLEWCKTSTMVASKVFAADGTSEAIVTTFLLDCRIRHHIEPLGGENKPAADDDGCMYNHDHSAQPELCERHD